jgi:hypothetical protein
MSIAKKIRTGLFAGLLVALTSVTLTSCAVVVSPLLATLYTNVKFHTGDHNQTIGSKRGESCATNILGLIATGDASVVEAARQAGIQKVTSVDYSVSNVLGLYATYCVIVTGE